MLAVQQLDSGYGESVILRDTSLRVRAGQVVCLLGRNGVGKTTLIKTVMELLKARQGEVGYNGAGVIRSIKGDGRTAILLVEQSLEFVKDVGGYFYVIDKGGIAWEGEPEALTDEVVRQYLTL